MHSHVVHSSFILRTKLKIFYEIDSYATTNMTFKKTKNKEIVKRIHMN